ncbi:MAG: hypothetical protein E7658_09670 [Ruminococcaceae bacterium]|nr:hypothetical protein [Oscillospiraceae bacterium]
MMNQNIESILQSHAEAYPLMEPRDAVKLIYQSVFGPGHFIPSPSSAAEWLKKEYNTVSHENPPRIESLGSTARVYIDTPFTEEKLNLLARVFCASAESFCKGYDTADEGFRGAFEENLACLRGMAETGRFVFSVAELDAWLAEYRAAGYPPVSHSETYRRAYAPAYRVIDSRYVRILGLLAAIDTRLAASDRVVLAVDGRCASGKSTIAEYISRMYPTSVIHMDDFFLPGELRTPERMAETGGNLHRERFLEEVIPHLRGRAFTHRVFQCSTFTYAETPRTVEDNPLILCEGSYALHPDFGKYYDMAVFSDIEPEKQLTRIRERDGEYMLNRFRNEWIPMEEKYFTEMHIREKCDFVLD